jgi:hypothetical protein
MTSNWARKKAGIKGSNKQKGSTNPKVFYLQPLGSDLSLWSMGSYFLAFFLDYQRRCFVLPFLEATNIVAFLFFCIPFSKNHWEWPGQDQSPWAVAS